MKKISMLSFIFFLVISFNSKGQTSELVDTWAIDWTRMYSAMNQTEKSRFDGLSQEIKSKAEGSFSTRTYEFRVDGEMVIQWRDNGEQKTVAGTWNKSESTLTLTANGVSVRYTASISNDILMLTAQAVSANALFSKLVMNKQ